MGVDGTKGDAGRMSGVEGGYIRAVRGASPRSRRNENALTETRFQESRLVRTSFPPRVWTPVQQNRPDVRPERD